MSTTAVPTGKWVGRSIPRLEDGRLLTGRGTFIEDMTPVPNIHHAAILRSPHAHARILSIDASEALKLPGVVSVLTGEDVKRMSKPFSTAAITFQKYYSCAIEKVRHVGEPVAVVVARNRYIAEDALPLIKVEYEPLPAVVCPEKAMEPGAPLLHEEGGTNAVLHRQLTYGDPDKAFEDAHLVVKDRFVFPKYGSTPLETYGLVAAWEPSTSQLTIWSNFHGPFSMHPVVANSLGLPNMKLRFIVPEDIGGGFGIKTSIYPYLTLMGLAAMKAGVPVKWIEDRQGDLLASSSGTDRVSWVEAACDENGVITGMRMKIYDNVGAHLRAPEPGCLFRPLGNYVGAYRFRNLFIDAYGVTTNKMMTGPNRGYGCQQLYFGIERLVDDIAEKLNLDPAEVRRRNLIQPEQMPYTTPTGGIYDAGDYPAALEKALEMADYENLRREVEEAKKQGKMIGIGFGCGIDPSVSNMGYVTIAQTPEQRAKGRRKSGSTQATSISIDSLGQVTVELSTTPQGQSHETVIAQVLADELTIDPYSIQVISGMDTATRAWTIPSGSYSSRFASIGVSSAVYAARKLKEKIFKIAAHTLEAEPEDMELTDGKVHVKGAPDRHIKLRHVAGIAHWDPQSLPEGMEPGMDVTYYYTMPTAKGADEFDRIDSSNTYGFMIDLVVVEIEPDTHEVQIKKYVTVHDAGTILNPQVVEGQIYGAALHGIAGALYEEMAYSDDGQCLTGTFMDYLCPTFMEMPKLDIGHVIVPSPFTALGAKGMGESTTETAPVAIANAVADALKPLGVEIKELPLTPDRVWRLVTAAREAQKA